MVKEDCLDDRLIGIAGRGAADRSPQPGEKLIHTKGFGDVVVCSRVEGLDLVQGVGTRGQNKHRCRQPTAQSVEYVDPAHVRQPEIQYDDVGAVLRRSA